jgi:hypothetical protein
MLAGTSLRMFPGGLCLTVQEVVHGALRPTKSIVRQDRPGHLQNRLTIHLKLS